MVVQTAHHREWVEGSGISGDITDLNLQSISGGVAREVLGWGEYNGDGEDPLKSGWWCESVEPETGRVSGFGQFKPDKVFKFKGKKTAKYLSPKKPTEAIFLRMPNPCYWQEVLEDVSIPLFVTEGVKKAGAILSLDRAAVALVGVWNGQQAKGRELIDTLKPFAQPGRVVVFVFDADLILKTQVRDALDNLASLMIGRGCPCRITTWDIREGKGIDDVLVHRGADRVREILDAGLSLDEWRKTGTGELVDPQTAQGKIWNYVTHGMANDLEIDEFSLEYRSRGLPLVIPALQARIAESIGMDVPKSYLIETVDYYAKQHPYSDVREYLKNCAAMYGQSRGYIQALIDVMGLVPDIEKLLMFKWLIAAVARAMMPGCKFDSVLIQKGREGLGKTRLMQILAGANRFTEMSLESGNKDQLQIAKANWIIELGEIESTFRRSDISHLKMFITQTQDEFRVPYGSRSEKFPRHFLFCGSTNSDTVITDPDGVRRWWVVQPTKRFDLEWVERNRDRIWAEAYWYFENADIKLYLTDEENEAFVQSVKPHRKVGKFYDGLEKIMDKLMKGSFRLVDVLETFHIYPGMKDYDRDLLALASDLKLLGFVAEGKQRRINGVKAKWWNHSSTLIIEAAEDEEPSSPLLLPYNGNQTRPQLPPQNG
jgi:hypothetical protein